jgi:hypothetical protein
MLFNRRVLIALPLKLEENRDLTLLHFRCVYEDKYIVSYNEGITPVKRYSPHQRLINI